MRQNHGSLNRIWLAIIGLVVLLLGIAGLLFATGLASTLGPKIGLGGLAPPTGPVVRTDVRAILQPDIVAVAAAVGAIILALLALAWLFKQIPRKNPARPLRLHEDGAEGLTLCNPQVITSVIEDQVEDFPGVVYAGAILRGTASSPELTVNATVNDRANIREVVEQIHERTAADLETALESPLQRLAIRLDVSGTTKGSKTVVL